MLGFNCLVDHIARHDCGANNQCCLSNVQRMSVLRGKKKCNCPSKGKCHALTKPMDINASVTINATKIRDMLAYELQADQFADPRTTAAHTTYVPDEPVACTWNGCGCAYWMWDLKCCACLSANPSIAVTLPICTLFGCGISMCS